MYKLIKLVYKVIIFMKTILISVIVWGLLSLLLVYLWPILLKLISLEVTKASNTLLLLILIFLAIILSVPLLQKTNKKLAQSDQKTLSKLYDLYNEHRIDGKTKYELLYKSIDYSEVDCLIAEIKADKSLVSAVSIISIMVTISTKVLGAGLFDIYTYFILFIIISFCALALLFLLPANDYILYVLECKKNNRKTEEFKGDFVKYM